VSTSRPTAGEAIAKAEAAHAKIEAHEDICAIRYSQIHNSLQDIKDAVKAIGDSQSKSAPKAETDRLWGVLWGLAGSLIVLLLGVSGWLLTHPDWASPKHTQAVQVQATVR
jgi:hypothetical protein